MLKFVVFLLFLIICYLAKSNPYDEAFRSDGQIEWVDLRDMIKKPVYMGLQEEVIPTQPIRPPRPEYDPIEKTEKPTQEDSKPQTRIPVSRFKPAAERVLKERTDAKNGEQQKSKQPPEKPRRTSIPKLKDRLPVAKKNPATNDAQPVKKESQPIKDKPVAKNSTATDDGKPVKKERQLVKDKLPVANKDPTRDDAQPLKKERLLIKDRIPEAMKDIATDDAQPVKKESHPIKDGQLVAKKDPARDDAQTVKKERQLIKDRLPMAKKEIATDGAQSVKKESHPIKDGQLVANKDPARDDAQTVKKERQLIKDRLPKAKKDIATDDAQPVKKESHPIKDGLLVTNKDPARDDAQTVQQENPTKDRLPMAKKYPTTDEVQPVEKESHPKKDKVPVIKKDIAAYNAQPVEKESPIKDKLPVAGKNPAIDDAPQPGKKESHPVKDKLPVAKKNSVIDDPQPVEKVSPIKDGLPAANKDPKRDVPHPVEKESLIQNRQPDASKNPAIDNSQSVEKESHPITDILHVAKNIPEADDAQPAKKESHPTKDGLPVANKDPTRDDAERDKKDSQPTKERLPVAKKDPATGDVQPVEKESHPIKENKETTPVVKTSLKRATPSNKIPVMSKDHYKIKKNDDQKYKQAEKADISKDPQLAIKERNEQVKTKLIEQVEDEFDKLYEGMVDANVASLPDDILQTRVKDPEKLEIKFEEIVHQYDDPPIEQVKIEPSDKARYSKLPLLGRRSSQDLNIAGQAERRLPLKTGTINKTKITNDQKPIDTVNKKDYIKQNSVSDNIAHEYKDSENDNAQHDSIIEINNNEENIEDRYIEMLSPDPQPDYNMIATPDSELVKVGICGISSRDIPLEESKQNVATPEIETVKVAHEHKDSENDNAQHDSIIEINNNEENIEDRYIEMLSPNPLPDYNMIATPDSELVKVGIFGISSRDIPLEEAKQSVATPELETVKVAVMPIEQPTTHINEKNLEEVESDCLPNTQNKHKSPVDQHKINHRPVDKISLPKKEERTDIVNDDNNIYIHNKVDDMYPPQKNIFIRNPDNELKSYNLLKNTPKDETKPNKEAKIEEDIPIVKGKVSRILKRLTSQENLNNNFATNNNTDRQVKDVNKQMEDIPKKKSVLSKIAMFERGDTELQSPTIATHKYSKPIRTISEDLKHSPKIIQEVLKPKGVETDKQTIVTIDIMSPVEVITNNEEQISVVEILKEDTVIYDNFDADRNNKVKNEPDKRLTRDDLSPKGIHTNKHTFVAADVLKPVEVANSDEQVTVVEKLNETIKTYENLDHYRQNEIDPVEVEPESLNNETVLADINTSVDNLSNYDRIEDKYLEPYSKRECKKENKMKEKWKSTDALSDYLPVKEKINRLKSYEDTNLKKAKSTAELDLGDAVKGKVKKMIVRMNSFEVLDDVNFKPKEVQVISPKERPRKRSVSEKIALFERKLTPVTMDNTKMETARSLHPHPKPVKDGINAVPPVKESPTPVTVDAAKIKQLNNAKLTFGSVTNMSYMPLRDGRKMPVLALGTALLEPTLTPHIVSAAIDLGYRAIDTAYIYGNEREVGEGIRAKIQDGTVRREELFIMNKMWSTFHRPDLVEGACRASLAAVGLEYFDLYMIHNPMSFKELFIMNKMWSTFHRPDLVEGACRASLAAVGLEYFDLYMIHNPMSFKEGGDPLPKIANVLQFSEFDYLDAWFAMEELVGKGLARSIGVSNFNSVQLARILEKGRIKPVVNQVECHPYLNQQRLSDFCDARDVRLSCFGTLGSKGTPAEFKNSTAAAIDDPLVQVMAAGLGVTPAQLLISQQRLSDFCEARDVRLSCFGTLGSKGTPAELKNSTAAAIDDPLVQVMAAGLGVTPAQLLIRYQLDSGHAVVAKASSPAHLWNNLQALGVTLDAPQLAALHALNKNKRTFTFTGMGDTHKNYPFKIAF